MLINDKTPPSALQVSLNKTGVLGVSGAGKSNPPKAFAQALNQVRQVEQGRAEPVRTIKNGDTLIGLVRQQASAQGVSLKPSQEMRLAHQVALDSGIKNPNWIFPGQKINLNSIQPEILAAQKAPVETVIGLAAPGVVVPVALAPASVGSANPVLDKTLDRAVAKGFIPVAEKTAVYDKILELASTHRFKPDDFARMTLMESDGMNPRASNQRCHGIIQFCDGPARGAATAGYAANPRAILDLSVHKQLGLVDKYFEEVGLKNQGPAGLEDLYLSVLKPAARSETQAAANLNIPGAQSKYLHEGRDTSAPITRQSIRQGLLQNAADRLGQIFSPTPAPRLQAMRASKYNDSASN